MLVLSRQRDETIVIGDSIRVTIVEVRGDKVRIGIDAPRDVTVHRQEIYGRHQTGIVRNTGVRLRPDRLVRIIITQKGLAEFSQPLLLFEPVPGNVAFNLSA